MSLLEKYPDLDIKYEKYLGDGDSVEGKSDASFLATETRSTLSNLVKLVLESAFVWSRLSQLLRKTVNLTDLELDIYKYDSSFKLYPLLEQIAKLPLKTLTLNASIYGDDKKEELEYKMSVEDYSSLGKVLNIRSLRVVHVDFNLIPDVQKFYDVVIESANNNLNNIDVSFRRVKEDLDVYLISCSVPGDDFRHGVTVDSLTEFSIVGFMKKFNGSRTRRFEVICTNDEEWVKIGTEFNAYIESHHSHNYTLARVTEFPIE